jgi:hypothetical protein
VPEEYQTPPRELVGHERELLDAEHDALRRVYEIDEDILYLRSHTGGLTVTERDWIRENLKSRRIAHRCPVWSHRAATTTGGFSGC